MARSNKHRKAKTKFKFTKEFIFLVLFLIVIGIATGLLGIRSKADKLYDKITAAQSAASSSSSTITTLSEDNVYKEISYKNVINKIKKSSYTYVYYGSYDDANYLTYLEDINQKAQTYEVGTVYLLDSSWAVSVDIEDEDHGEENNEILTQVEKALDGVDLKKNPQLWVFKDGKIQFNSQELLDDTYQTPTWPFIIEQAFGHYNNKGE